MKNTIIGVGTVSLLALAQGVGAWKNPDTNIFLQTACGLVGLALWALLAAIIIAIPCGAVWGLWSLGKKLRGLS